MRFIPAMERLAARFIGGVVHECAEHSINPPHGSSIIFDSVNSSLCDDISVNVQVKRNAIIIVIHILLPMAVISVIHLEL